MQIATTALSRCIADLLFWLVFLFFSPPKKIPNYVAAFLIKMRGMWTKAEEETFAVVPILTVRLQSPK